MNFTKTTVSCLLSALLLLNTAFTLTSCGNGGVSSKDVLSKLSAGNSDSTGKVLSGISAESFKRKKKNPILFLAHSNKLFNANKWVKSDRAFFNRLHPNRISNYDKIIKKMARRYGFDWRLIAAQMYVESNFRNTAKSHVGAQGLMQVLPSTAKFMGIDSKRLIDPATNISVGCMYNQRMYSLWGRQTKQRVHRMAFALASYNAGRRRVLRSYSTDDSLTTWGKVHPSLPQETQMYVHKIYLKLECYKKYILP